MATNTAFLAVLLLSAAVAVSARGAFFGGAFAVGDPYCVFCPDTNLLSEAGLGCHCPAGFSAYPAAPISTGPWKLEAPATPLMRVASTCSTHGAQWHSSLSFCIADSANFAHNSSRYHVPAAGAVEQFAGVYQTVAGECRHPNPLTGDCSCPSDSESIKIGHQSVETKTPVTFASNLKLEANRAAELVFCARRSSASPFNFAGAYTTHTETQECDSVNPFSGACSCPVGSSATTLGLVGLNGKGMTVHICGPHMIKAPMVQICQGVDADSSGTTDAGPAINRCIQQRNSIEFPHGTYLINTQIRTDNQQQCQMQARQSQGNVCLLDSNICPVLKAGPSLSAAGGLFSGRCDMENIIFDGNRAARTHLISQCATNPTVGFVMLQRPTHGSGQFQMQGCAVINAVCGAGLYAQSIGSGQDNGEVESCLFRGNGAHNEATKEWANGIQVGAYSNQFEAQQNYFHDNSDSHIAVEEPSNEAQVEENRMTMQSSFIFAGIRNSYPVNGTFAMREDGTWGEVVPTAQDLARIARSPNDQGQYEQNSINLNGLGYFGICIGGRPWKPNSPVVQQGQEIEVEENQVSGAAVLINIDAAVVYLQQNQYGNYQGKFQHCPQPNALLNISPESRASRQDSVSPTHITYAGCVP